MIIYIEHGRSTSSAAIICRSTAEHTNGHHTILSLHHSSPLPWRYLLLNMLIICLCFWGLIWDVMHWHFSWDTVIPYKSPKISRLSYVRTLTIIVLCVRFILDFAKFSDNYLTQLLSHSSVSNFEQRSFYFRFNCHSL